MTNGAIPMGASMLLRPSFPTKFPHPILPWMNKTFATFCRMAGSGQTQSQIARNCEWNLLESNAPWNSRQRGASNGVRHLYRGPKVLQCGNARQWTTSK